MAVRRDGGASVSSVGLAHTPAGPVSPLTAVVSKVATPVRPADIDFGAASANDGMLILLLRHTNPARAATPALCGVSAADWRRGAPATATRNFAFFYAFFYISSQYSCCCLRVR